MRFPMPKIAGRRTDQLSDFMAVLEFGAVDLDHCLWIPDQRLRQSFNGPCFPRASGAQKQEVPDGSARCRKTGHMHLVDINRSEERRVGKECKSWGDVDQY